jgi:hypothetical protein
MHHNGPIPCSWFHGIYVSSPDFTVKNNLSYLNASVGIALNHDWARGVIANNTTFRNGYIGISANGADFREFTAAGPVVIENNISYDNNNFSTSNQGSYAGIAIYGTVVAGNAIRNNFSANNHDVEIYMPSDKGVVSGNITTGSPGFVNYQTTGTGDYHLASGSQLIDKGLAANAPTTDLDGITRPQGAGYDIGAYEYTIATGTENISAGETSLILYPNPSTTNFTLIISSAIILKDAAMKIYDVYGKEVKEVVITSHEITIDRDDLSRGVYFYSVINNQETMINGKLMVR